jgi:cytochrome c-type biogenesis protein CcmE
VVQDASGEFPVVYKGGPVPDIFGEQVEVVVEGKYLPDGTFAAETLLAKCPSKFEDGQQASL